MFPFQTVEIKFLHQIAVFPKLLISSLILSWKIKSFQKTLAFFQVFLKLHMFIF